MTTPLTDPAAEDVRQFYERRGYRHTIGAGQSPAIVVIDFSRAFTAGTSAEGPSTFPGGDFAAEMRATRRLLDAARGRHPVFFTTIAYEPHLRDAGFWAVKVPWLAHCLLGDPIVDIDPALGRRADEPVIVKKYPSAFFGTDLHDRLARRAVDTLIIAGCTTSVCVRATALDAMQHGYRPLVAEDAVGDFNRNVHALHLLDLKSRYADVLPVDALVPYLAGTAPPAG